MKQTEIIYIDSDSDDTSNDVILISSQSIGGAPSRASSVLSLIGSQAAEPPSSQPPEPDSDVGYDYEGSEEDEEDIAEGSKNGTKGYSDILNDSEDDLLLDFAKLRKERNLRRTAPTSSISEVFLPEVMKFGSAAQVAKPSTVRGSSRPVSSPKKAIRRSKKTEEEKLAEQARKEEAKLLKKQETEERRKAAAKAKEEERERKLLHKSANKLVNDKKDTLIDMAIELGSYPYEIFKAQLGIKMAEFNSTVSPLSADLPIELKAGFRNLVTWKRQIKALYNESTKQYEAISPSEVYWRRENTYMLYYTASDIFEHGENVKETIIRLKRAIEDSSARQSPNGKSKSARLMIMVDGWLKFKGKVEQKRKLERMFVRLQMDRCSVVHVEGKEDAVTWLYNLTADLGMKPHKLRQRSFLPFCPLTGIPSGTDVRDTYLKTLQQIPRVTSSGADGIRAMYPTMRSLFEAYEARSENKVLREGLLVNAKVSYTKSGQVNKRNVMNQALSTRIASVLWNDDPLEIIGV